MLQEYHIPDSVQAVLRLLKESKGKARVIAGGTDLVLDYQNEKINADAFVDISHIEELKKIECVDDVISIGAGVTHSQVVNSKLIQEHIPALAEAARAVGSLQIRNIATVVGNIVNAQPAADTAGILIALGAEAEVMSDSKVEYVPVEKMYAGVGQSTVDSNSQLVTQIRFTALKGHWGTAFVRHSRRKALALPMLNVAAVVSLKNDKFEWARLVMAPVGPRPIRAIEVENMLKGSPVTDEVIDKAAQLTLQNANPRDSMIRGSREYRLGVLPVLMKRAIVKAVARAKKKDTGGEN